MASRSRRMGHHSERLIEKEDSIEGISNPSLDSVTEAVYQKFSQSEADLSTAELVEEISESKHLVKDLKKRRQVRKQKLSQLTSPKDDIAGELKITHSASRQRLASVISEAEHATLSADQTTPYSREVSTIEQSSLSVEDEHSTFPMYDAVSPDKMSESFEAATADKAYTAERKETRKEEALAISGEPSLVDQEIADSKKSSLRDRMKARLAKAKENAEGEMEEEARQVRQRQRVQRAQMSDEDAMAGMDWKSEEKQRSLRIRWQKITEVSGERSGVQTPSAEDAYDFFTRFWEPEIVVQKDDEKKDVVNVTGTENVSSIQETGDNESKPEVEQEVVDVDPCDDKKPLLEDEDFDEEGYGPTAIRHVEILSPDTVKEAECRLLFVPSLLAAPLSQKVSESKERRILEDEGFYVGIRPEVALRNKNKMENRLLAEPDHGTKWFGDDGEVAVFSDPLRLRLFRPSIPETTEPYLETYFRKAVMQDFDSRYIDGIVDGSGQYQMDVDVNCIAFSHHHLFSREHVLSSRLTQLYSQYTTRYNRNMVNLLTDKLHAVKSSSRHLQNYIQANKSNMVVSDRTDYERRLHDYKLEIRQTREIRDREELLDMTLMKNIINTWKEIRTLRRQQQSTNTPLRLKIIKEEVDKVADEIQWQNDLQDELEDAHGEHAEEYSRKITLYKDQLEKLEKQQSAKNEARKIIHRQRRSSKTSRASKSSKGSTLEAHREFTESEMVHYNNILNEEEISKPDLPEEFDECSAKERIINKFVRIRRCPGEIILHAELSNTMPVTPAINCPRAEQHRRDEVSRCKVFVKVLFNNKEVSRTGCRPLSQDFRVMFGQIYNLRIVQWPESIKFQIFEMEGLSCHLLAEIYTPIPECSVTSQVVQLEDTEFSSDVRVPGSHSAVGSGMSFVFDATSNTIVTLMTSGTVTASVAWAVNEDGVPLVPLPSPGRVSNLFTAFKKSDPLAALGAIGVVNIEKLSKWFHESRMDPNDPANADLLYLIGSQSGNLGPRDYFRLEQLQQEFNFVTDADIAANRRFQILSLRDRQVAEFCSIKMVASLEREIPRDAFLEYEKKKREGGRRKMSDDYVSIQQTHSRYVEMVRDQILMRFRLASHHKRLEDVVVEEAVPEIAMLGIGLLRLAKQQRPLKPVRKERKKLTGQAVKADDVRVLVNIIHVSNIPTRKASSYGASPVKEADHRQHIINIAGDVQVHPYVEVMFQRNVVRTGTADGPNPCFNEELELPLKAPNDDFSTNSLQNIQDSIYLNLFDEVIVDILEDDRERDTSVHHRLEKKWLGNIRIPFSTVYLNGKIDGTFRLNTPSIMLGYSYNSSMEGDFIDTTISSHHDYTHISVFVTIEPPLKQPEPALDRFETNEDGKLMQYSEQWQADLQKLYPQRHYKASVIDVNGKNVFLTRYFKALNAPPEILEKSENDRLEFVARFVSLIPFVSDASIFPGLCEIWSTCDQFLQMLAGDEEEHAVMLTNFFLGLGLKAYILLGSAIPEGTTAYVLTEQNEGFRIWNAANGKSYSIHDSYCPLYSVGCLVNVDNIWANIHQYEKPSQIDFNVCNTKFWRPFFSRSNPSLGLSSIQPEALIYHGPKKGYLLDLQEKIEQLLKNKIMEWRNRFLTRWNRHCTQIMRKLLPRLEENCGKVIDQQHLLELEDSFRSYKVSGFPINIPFIDLSSMTDAVFSTGVHSQETSSVEFALAVYVHGYSNSVLSIWIYVASLVRLR